MKKLALFAFPLLLASCNLTGVSPSSFSAEAGGVGQQIIYHYVYSGTGPTRVFMGYYYELASQPTIIFTNHAGSVGASFNEAVVTIQDQNGNPINLGTTDSGAAVVNPYSVSFMARLIPGWACPTAAGAIDSQADPNSCAGTVRVPYVRQVTYPAEGNPVTLHTPITTDKPVGVMPMNIASRLSTIAVSSTDSTFNGTMVIQFKGRDDVGRAVSVTTKPISLNVYRGDDKSQ